MDNIKLKIITPERITYESDGINQATLPVSDGEVTILPNHRSYIASLKPGEVILKKDGEEIDLAISGGFIEFHDNELVVLADEAERAEEIDLEKAEEAKKRAEDIKNKVISTDEAEYARVAAALEKELAKIKVAKKYLRRRGL
ncbi:MAG: ATP synthase F1 subunit epsilon [Candidatus Moranbacteria bacterium]|jgi:F-type H+-transporting ATPase subunit epsilon|nr:ATP synthase F1 subunit epsilon [Candidatus Moranbacteria bacterium]MDD5651896.1 ATP synthase F1 subunit epsilon [Candidatus Moranbacteria bacterium]MDX9855458.1 ATP synthase F1 subunit epsilon [Candidatus Moranbacteria bacterium]